MIEIRLPTAPGGKPVLNGLARSTGGKVILVSVPRPHTDRPAVRPAPAGRRRRDGEQARHERCVRQLRARHRRPRRNTRWTGLPPPTTPGSLARGLGQGVLQGRLPRGVNGASGTAPQPAEALQHEGQRSVAELGAILWHAMGGERDAPELAPWMARAHADPIVALTLSRQRLGEYAVRQPIDRNTAFPGPCVWLIEIERAKGDTPAAIAVWRSPARTANGAPAARACGPTGRSGRRPTRS